ncbi:MAG: helix-turn-helix domain-containing protein [Planctomycetes bacterium]|nr:helix-turn-helix domain-containing protein [Planctomycetota bacterium]
MSIRAIIIAEARRQNLSGYRIAKLSGIPMRTVQRYLAGDADIAGERLAPIIAALGLEVRPAKRARAAKGGK